jgi:hypothetical protein
MPFLLPLSCYSLLPSGSAINRDPHTGFPQRGWYCSKHFGGVPCTRNVATAHSIFLQIKIYWDFVKQSIIQKANMHDPPPPNKGLLQLLLNLDSLLAGLAPRVVRARTPMYAVDKNDAYTASASNVVGASLPFEM